MHATALRFRRCVCGPCSLGRTSLNPICKSGVQDACKPRGNNGGMHCMHVPNVCTMYVCEHQKLLAATSTYNSNGTESNCNVLSQDARSCMCGVVQGRAGNNYDAFNANIQAWLHAEKGSAGNWPLATSVKGELHFSTIRHWCNDLELLYKAHGCANLQR